MRKLQSANILTALETHPAFRAANTVLLYHSLNDEVDTHEFIRKWSNKKRILLPVVVGDDLELRIYAVAGKGKLTYYTIKSGDTLSTIAGKYGVTIKDIQRWNGMSNTKIAAGKRLKIYK